MKKILIIRFSALGDVAMTIPVIFSLAKKYPKRTFVFLTIPFFESLRDYLPKNIELLTADIRGEYNGIFGLYRLYRILKKLNFEAIADLHDVLRSQILRFFFFGQGIKICKIDKGRAEKKRLTRRENKQLYPLISQFERYKKVFEALQLPFDWNFTNIFNATANKINQENWLGIAPFSQHQGKTYPLSNIEKIITHFHQKNVKIFLLGSAADGIKINILQQKYPYIVPIVDLALDQVLQKIQKMKVVLSMDSANLHFASLVNTPVVSVWGATHPYLGFYGWGQNKENIVQTNIYCSPCSTFGNKPCFRKDYACLNELPVEKVIERLALFLLQ